jgi:hypothetical protein
MSNRAMNDKARSVAEQLLHASARPPHEAVARPPHEASVESGPDRAPRRRFDRPRARRFTRWTDGLLRVHDTAATVLADLHIGECEAMSPDERNTDELAGLVADTHRMLLAHPAAARQVFAALVAEGRRYAETSAGRELQQQLVGSARAQHAARLFRALNMGMLDDDRETRLPSTYLDNLLRIVDEGRVEELTADLLTRLWGR